MLTLDRLFIAIFSAVLPAGVAMAQDDSLGSEANDPTASVMSFQLQDFYTYKYHNLSDGDGNRLQFRAAVPFTLGGYSNIFRLTAPYVTDSPNDASGWSDMTLFDLVTFDRSWGRFGVGAVALLPTGEDGLSAEKWGLGPAVGFVASKPWGIWGLFNQNVFTVAGDDDYRDVNISIVQPIVNYNLGNGWSAGASDMSVTYDWERHDWVSLPLGVALNKLVRIRQHPVQFTASYEHNFYDEGVSASDTINVTAKLLLP
ncbi:hypothetical protein [Halomonas getboli]|uniref:hypothetical protein n=1 Tax=Halomonas getboli TaxID=2935862 RepID=UPI001FFFDFCE|nr:hypothetical protein [Halomonas getboli]MCK2184135.1 hypothetical protein [Halomonas getboli]